MKNYKKQQYSGNENGWDEPIVTLGVTAIRESQADELNSHFGSTGIKYEETEDTPSGDAQSDTQTSDAPVTQKAKVPKAPKAPKALKEPKGKASAKPPIEKVKDTVETPVE